MGWSTGLNTAERLRGMRRGSDTHEVTDRSRGLRVFCEEADSETFNIEFGGRKDLKSKGRGVQRQRIFFLMLEKTKCLWANGEGPDGEGQIDKRKGRGGERDIRCLRRVDKV